MKKTTQTLEESLKQIKINMNYDSQKPLSEQLYGGSSMVSANSIKNMANVADTNTPTSTWGRRESAGTDVQEAWLNAQVRRINRWMGNINSSMKALDGRTFQGKNAVEALREKYKAEYKQDLPKYVSLGGQPVQTATAGGDGYAYKVSAGTPEDPYIYGSSGSGIKIVQQNLGGLDLDGKWGPKTQQAIAAKIPDLKQFTNDDLPTILQKIRGTESITSAPNMQQARIDVTPELDTSLKGVNKPQQNLANNTNIPQGNSRSNPSKGAY